MAILHGSWILQAQDQLPYFLIWGEVWRRVEPIHSPSANELPHPFAMSAAELQDLLRSLHQSQQLNWAIDFPLQQADDKASSAKRKRSTAQAPESIPRWQAIAFISPTDRTAGDSPDTYALLPIQPGLETEREVASEVMLHPWQVEGIRLTASEALQLLQSLPLSSVQGDELGWLGADLRFWSQIARWQLDLLARAKFLPTLEKQPAEATCRKSRTGSRDRPMASPARQRHRPNPTRAVCPSNAWAMSSLWVRPSGCPVCLCAAAVLPESDD